ncbi:MAG: bifunctional heptose 7-phosphate kinase/heptose 1-phosphate adenyltransferase [Nanoarchaeota archaeon]|nr:bifunctional heptose 7-phosphate kinase/heptose 1-phosphate adenyltransferase [Nanoarchaeota archaeon]
MDIKKVLDNFSRAKIAVVGDVILDNYIYGSVDRISPEAPVPIVKVEREICELGGSGNVAANISSLGGKVHLSGYIGIDNAADVLKQKLSEQGIDCNLFNILKQTTQKTRVIGNNHQITRIDRESCESISREFEEKLAEEINKEKPDIIIASDYAKGCLTGSLFSLIKKHNEGTRIIIDPKPRNKINYAGVYLITPNLKEAREITGLENINEIGKKLQEIYCCNVLLTMGKEGMSLFEGKKIINLPTQAREVYDVSGAGDTVIAVIGLGLASGLSLEESAYLANTAAGIVVGKAGTASVLRSELKEIVESGNRKIKTVSQLKSIRDDLRRKGKKVVFTSGCYDILHPGHIRFLEKAKTFGDVLILAINGDKSPFFKTKKGDRPILNEGERVEVLSGLKSVDYITIFDEDNPIGLIKELMPDIKVKGGSYVAERVAEEDMIICSYGGTSKYIEMIGEYSTTALIDKIRNGKK